MGIAVWSCSQGRFVRAFNLATKRNKQLSVMQDNCAIVQAMYKRLTLELKKYNVRCVLAEMPHGGGRNAIAVRCMALAVGYVVSACAGQNIPLRPVTPDQVKRIAIEERVPVSKTQIQQFVQRKFKGRGAELLPSSSIREHIADAMACMAVLMKESQCRKSKCISLT